MKIRSILTLKSIHESTLFSSSTIVNVLYKYFIKVYGTENKEKWRKDGEVTNKETSYMESTTKEHFYPLPNIIFLILRELPSYKVSRSPEHH